jgi:hypothetical protein
MIICIISKASVELSWVSKTKQRAILLVSEKRLASEVHSLHIFKLLSGSVDASSSSALSNFL